MKKLYPFNPVEDSLIGNIIFNIFKEESRERSFQEAINSYILEGDTYYFTPRNKKQTIMDIYPSKIRVWISQKKFDEIKNFFLDLLHGKLTDLPSMDIALELFEWILTGFQEEELSKGIFEILTNSKFHLQDNHLLNIQIAYKKILEEENSRIHTE